MTKELIDRLRDSSARHDKEADHLCNDAADAIESLQAENERLKTESLSYKIAWERTSDAVKDANAECDTMKARIRQLCDLVRKLHKAKGRHHTQLSVCDLFDAVGLQNKRPDAAIDAANGVQQ
jgi:predicted  nucleic acid-binding Zn-ribbon protein